MSIPDAGDVVEYGLDSFGKRPETYRVDAWLKPHVPPLKFTGHDMLTSGAMRHDLTKEQRQEALIIEFLEGELKSAQASNKVRLAWCPQAEATHLALSGICGRIASVAACKVVGRVNWSDQALAEHREEAVFLGLSRGVTDCVVTMDEVRP